MSNANDVVNLVKKSAKNAPNDINFQQIVVILIYSLYYTHRFVT